jgi:large subunit ribosomal protein L13
VFEEKRYQEKVADAMKTYSAKPSEVEAKWWIIDAEGVVLGRMATPRTSIAATMLS